MKIGKAMQSIREGMNLSRREMASKLGCTTASLWKIENCKTEPKKSTVDRFCFFTKTPMARLYHLAMEPKDYAPTPSIQDLVDAMRASGCFTIEEISSAATRLAAIAVAD